MNECVPFCIMLLQKFCFDGRLIFGPDGKSLILTVSLIVIPVILFCAFVSRRLVDMFPYHIGNLIVAIAVLFTVYVSSSSLDDWFTNSYQIWKLPSRNFQSYS